MTPSRISVAITTHNRIDDLTVTLERLEAYGEAIHEILVCADGCNDGTQAFVRETYPDIILLENNPGQGSIPSRNRMITDATAPYVLLLDDDSYPIEEDFFAQCTRIMESHPDIGVLTFPQRSDEFPETLEQASFGPSSHVGTFTSSGSLIRRELFLSLGGFPGYFFHAYEEPDFAMRVLASGSEVVQWTSLTVRHHYTQAMRDEGRTHRRHARNEMWSTLMRTPFPMILLMVPYRIFSQGRYAASRGFSWVLKEPKWWWEAIKGTGTALRHRQPVSHQAYKAWLRRLRRPAPLD
jgi:GT2 family glycosyltransferase